MTRKYRILKDFVINEVSCVDRPAQVGARALILKRDDSKMPKGKPYTEEELANMTEEERRKAKMTDDMKKKIDELTEKLEKSEKAAKDAADKVDYLSKVNSLSKAEREYFATLSSEAEQVAFVNKSQDEKTLILKNLADANPVIYKSADGTEFRKDDDPRMVRLAKQADDYEKKLAKAEALQKYAEYSKRARDELGNLTGDDGAKAELLKAVDSIESEEDREKVTKMLTSINKIAGKAFDRIGTTKSFAKSGTPIADLDDAVEKFASEKGMPIAKAYDAFLKTPEGARLYQEYDDDRKAAQSRGN